LFSHFNAINHTGTLNFGPIGPVIIIQRAIIHKEADSWNLTH
jgi:hypothetical protein